MSDTSSRKKYKQSKKSTPYSRARAARGPAAFIRGPIPQRGKELKFIDVTAATSVTDTTGAVVLLNGVATGDDFNTRDGRQVIMKSVQIRGIFDVNSATTELLARFMLVWDNAPNGVLATVGQILAQSTSLSEKNINNQNRFTILADEQRGFSGGGVVVGESQGYNTAFLRHVKLNHITQYLDTGATIASIQNGALLLLTIGNQAAGTGAGSIFFNTRVRYVEG